MKKFYASIALGLLLFSQSAFAMDNAMMQGDMSMSKMGEMMVTVHSLNVRAMASVKGKRLGRLKYGAKVMVEKKVGKWCEVTFMNKPAYVACAYLK